MTVKTITQVGTESVPIPPPGWGAVEKWVVEVASKLNRTYNIKVISIPSSNRTSIPNTEFVYLSRVCSLFKTLSRFEEFYIKKYFRVSPVRSYLNRKHTPSWSYTHYLKKELKRHETDLYHFHQRPDYISLTKPSKPVIIHLHNKIPGLTPNFPLFPSFFEGVDLSDIVITVSKELKNYFIDKGVERGKVKVLYNGVDMKKYRPIKKPPGLRMLFVGKLIERKGVVYLLKAFRNIRKEIPDAKLSIVGRKDEKSPYFKEIQENLMEGVELTGVVSEDELVRHYQNATLLLHPALYEAFGMTLVESMACGTPVIATDVGGIPEVLGNEGILVKPKDSKGMARAVIRLMDNTKKYNSLTKGVRKRVEENFSWESVARKLTSIYREF